MTNRILLAMAVLVMAAPLLLGIDGEFSGSDGQAQAAIAATGYRPWAQPLWSPPSQEVESLLFAVQAALGGLGLGYVLGRRRR
ncbi:MAG: energy-coupling factor ABC transporter substrate-binding protein [Magnetospirillum sp.]|nr:energy-coupling factor ABC transporter substrate-binding protein [Magnetospirillum sp.]